MWSIIYCPTCNFPVVKGMCLHTALGFSAPQWRAMSHEEKEAALRKANGQSAVEAKVGGQ